MSRLLRPFTAPSTYRALLFQLTALPLGALGPALLIAGWTVTAVLAITPLVVPLLIGLREAVGLLGRAERALARELLGAATSRASRKRESGFWRRGLSVLADTGFWKEQAYLLLRFLVGWPLALVQFSCLAYALWLTGMPIYYRFEDDEVFGVWNVDSLGEALLLVPVGLVVLALALHLVRPLAAGPRALASRLLGGDAAEWPIESPAETRARRLRALKLHAAATAAAALVLIVVWAATTRAYFWPVWALLPLALLLAIHAWVVLAVERPGLRRRTGESQALAAHIGISAAIAVFLLAVWALTDRGYFWPVWALLGLAVLVVVHAAFVFARRQRRIEVLETTRAGAVDVQETELRRIERDLHDGAQARLVALGMSLGMAEQKLQSDPQAAQELLAEARRGAVEALQELRDLARGIRPPVLTDRGLEAAVSALAVRAPLRVTLAVDVPRRPAPAVETAAYFVVAEALTNSVKHAGAGHVEIQIRSANGVLGAEVVDDGRGGADPGGGGLTGLRRRVEALDGKLVVTSPAGGPTTVRAELPCE